MGKKILKDIKNMTDQQMQIFDGLMISDAYLRKNKGANGNASFLLTTSKKEFAEKVMQIFSIFPWSDKSLTTFDRYDKRTDNYHSSTVLRSRSIPFFTNQFNRWYPNGKKIIPKDIKINRDMLLWWYIGDGYLRKPKSRPNYRRVELATDSFSIEDVSFIIDKLKLALGDSSIYEERNEIMIGKQALVKFSNLLGTVSPVEDYQYKFDFGQYLNKNYFKSSFKDRPIHYINEFRKKNKVRELDFRSKSDIRKVV